MPWRRNDHANRQVILLGKGKIALIVCRHRHNGAGAVSHEHVVGDPNRNPFVIDWIDGIRAGENAGFLFICRQPFNFRRPHRLVAVGLHHLTTLVMHERLYQRMLRRQDHKRRAPERIRACGENLHVMLPLLGLKTYRGARAASDPVRLHGLYPLGPLHSGEIEQFVSIGRNLEKPLIQVFLHHWGIAAFAMTIVAPDLLTGQGGITGRAKIDRRLLFIGQAFVIQF